MVGNLLYAFKGGPLRPPLRGLAPARAGRAASPGATRMYGYLASSATGRQAIDVPC
jgi:hypothetical protein